MATEIGDGIREETASELERIRREVLIAKQELLEGYQYRFRMLREEHLEMGAQLDEVVRLKCTVIQLFTITSVIL